jgi:hypothetical protein
MRGLMEGEGEMGVGCGAMLGAVAARPGQRGEVVKGRWRRRSPASVLKDEEEAGWTE